MSSSYSNGSPSGRHRDSRDGTALMDNALAMAASLAAGRKQALAAKLHEAASATRDFGDSLDELPNIRGYIEEAADAIEGFGAYVEDAELGDMVDDAESFARRRPIITFGFMLLAGVAVSRMVQSHGTPSLPRSRGGAARSSARRRRYDA